ncbi:MAG: hypothetical protein OHK005_11940 [Candidatus Methylacidiphilales bacterium]
MIGGMERTEDAPGRGVVGSLALMDGIGPFFRGVEKRRINWSKIPFGLLPVEGSECRSHWDRIREDLRTVATRARGLGFTGLTLDDVAHLSDHPWLEASVRARNGVFREEFSGLIADVRAAGLEVYLTADFVTASAAVEARLGGRAERAAEWFAECAGEVLDQFPEVSGIILRIGESDAPDVTDLLRSRLYLRTARETNAMLRRVLPVFEERKRHLIFRTWTVGAYLVGDLIWHRGRIARALQGIRSPWFVVSMKYGESDFFRYLPLNRHFFRIDLPKIIEFQARREYEGAGEFPSFVGWDCERVAGELAGASGVIGLSVWAQTGGWHGFRRLAFLQPEARWIDLNTLTILRVVRDGKTVEEAVAEFFGPEQASPAMELLRLSDEVIRRLFYVEEFARQKLFFRRVRIPPLIHVYWDSIFVHETVRKVLRHFVRDPEQALREGEAAFGHFERMAALADQLGFGQEDIDFMRDTAAVLLLARRYFFLPDTPALREELRRAKKKYKERWPKGRRPRYRIRIGFSEGEGRWNQRAFHWLLLLFVRRQRGYRHVVDRMFTLTVLSWIYRLFRARHQDAIPKFMKKTAMGLDTLFR